MPKACSNDLHERVVKAVEAGQSFWCVAEFSGQVNNKPRTTTDSSDSETSGIGS